MIFKVNVWSFATITAFQFLDFSITPERPLIPIYSQPLLIPLFLIMSLKVPYNLTTLYQGLDISHVVILVSKESENCSFKKKSGLIAILKKNWLHCLKKKITPREGIVDNELVTNDLNHR